MCSKGLCRKRAAGQVPKRQPMPERPFRLADASPELCLWLLGANQLPFFCSVKGQRAAKLGCTHSLEQSINSFHQKQGVRFNLFSSLIRDFLRISHFASWLEMAVFRTVLPAPRKAQGALPSICQAEQETGGGGGDRASDGKSPTAHWSRAVLGTVP